MGVKEKLNAESLLRDIGVADTPVDVVKVAEHIGLRVEFVDMGQLSDRLELDRKLDRDNSSGLLDVPNKTIYVNKFHHEHRQRFTIAHEIGHFRMHQDVALKFLDVNFFTRDARVKNWMEDEANNFAAFLLAPKYLLEAAIKKYSSHGTVDLDGLARCFKLSPAAMSIRVNNYLAFE